MSDSESKSSTTGLGFLLLLLGAACIAAPFVLGNNREEVLNSAFTHVNRFELDDVLHAGQFRSSPRIGDTLPSNEAAFYAVSVLSGGKTNVIKNLAGTKTYAQQLDAVSGDKSLEQIHQVITLRKGLRLLNVDDVSAATKSSIDKYYNNILQLHESGSGFRSTAGASPSVGATYHAFKSLEELGKLSAFKRDHSDDFSSSISFILSLKDKHGGFRDAASAKPSVLATWQAVRVLRSDPDSHSFLGQGIPAFLGSTQLQDGGFSPFAIENVEDFRNNVGSTASTAQAVYIIETLQALKLADDVDDRVDVSAAATFLNAAVTKKHGVVRAPFTRATDLEATYYFTQLVSQFPSFSFGSCACLSMTGFFAGAALILIGLIHVLNLEIPATSGITHCAVVKQVGIVLVLASVGVASLGCSECKCCAVISYALLLSFIGTQAYDYAQNDREGFMTLAGGAYTGLHMLLLFGLNSIAPAVFSLGTGFAVLALWDAVAAFAVSYIGCFLQGKQRFNIYVKGAFLGWAANTVLQYSYIYARGDIATTFHLLNVRGLVPSVFVVVPVVTLALSYHAAALGCSMSGARK